MLRLNELRCAFDAHWKTRYWNTKKSSIIRKFVITCECTETDTLWNIKNIHHFKEYWKIKNVVIVYLLSSCNPSKTIDGVWIQAKKIIVSRQGPIKLMEKVGDNCLLQKLSILYNLYAKERDGKNDTNSFEKPNVFYAYRNLLEILFCSFFINASCQYISISGQSG